MSVLAVSDRTQETAQNIGASTPITLLGVAGVGLQAFPARLDGQLVPYTIEHETSGQWEVGEGIYSHSAKTLARTIIYDNSNGNTSLVNFANGIVDVWIDLPAEKAVMLDADSDDLTLPGNLALAGAVTSGTWNATPITTAYGGTGLTGYAAGDTLYYVSGTTLTRRAIGAANTVSLSDGTKPTWAANLPYATLPTGNGTWDNGSGNTVTFAQNVTVSGTLTASGTFIGSAAAGSLTGTTLASNVVTSSLTTIGTLLGGAVPASLVTAGTFGAGGYTFPSTLSTSGLLTASAGLTVSSGQTFTVAGVTISGAPSAVSGTWAFTNASPFSLTNGQVLTVATTAQTVGAATLTIPNFAGISDTFAFVTLAQTLSNKTLASPTVTGTIALTGATVAGAPTWSSNQTFPQVTTGALIANGTVTFNGGTTAKVVYNSARTLSITFAGGGTSGGGIFLSQASNGTIASPTATASGDFLGSMLVQGYDGSSYISTGSIIFNATQAWSVGANGSSITIKTTPNGSATQATALTIGQDQSTTFAGLATGAFNGRFGPNFTIGNSGAAILSQAALRVASTITTSSGNGYGIIHNPTIVASANNDNLIGINIGPTLTPGSFTGLVYQAIVISSISVAGFTSPGNPVQLTIGQLTATGATSASSIELGAGPTGATNNYLIHATNFQLTSSGSLVTAAGFGCNGKTAQTAFASGGAAPAGGTGTAAGGWDTAAHRDAAITLLNNIRTALVNNGIMS